MLITAGIGSNKPQMLSLYPHYIWRDHRGVTVSKGLLLCVSSFFALILFMNRLALQGGWVCFQFSPLPCPGKHHFQNQTNKIKNIFLKHRFLCCSPQYLSPLFYVSNFILKDLQWYQNIGNPEQTLLLLKAEAKHCWPSAGSNSVKINQSNN